MLSGFSGNLVMQLQLTKGQTAINFKTKDVLGNSVTLKDFYGKKLLISFQRGVRCPFCSLRAHQLSRDVAFYTSKGMQVLLVTESDQSTILASNLFSKITIPVIPDPERDLYKSYKVELSYLKTFTSFLSPRNVGVLLDAMANHQSIATEAGTHIQRIPAEFLIDERGIIQEAYYGKSVSDHIPASRIEAFMGQSFHAEIVL